MWLLSQHAFDVDRLLRYSFFTDSGLTIHSRGLNALIRFMAAKSELFRAVFRVPPAALRLAITAPFVATLSGDAVRLETPAAYLDSYR